jgi:hypothetical protein
MQSGNLLPAFLRNMLHLSKDRRMHPGDGDSRFLDPVVNKLLEITIFHIPEDNNHGLIKFGNYIFILCLISQVWLFSFSNVMGILLPEAT